MCLITNYNISVITDFMISSTYKRKHTQMLHYCFCSYFRSTQTGYANRMGHDTFFTVSMGNHRRIINK